MSRRWNSSREASAYLGLAEQTLANWRYLGKGPRYYRVGQLVKYDERDLDLWLEAGAVDSDRADDRPAA